MTKLKAFAPILIISALAVLYGGGASSVHAAAAMPKPLIAEKTAKAAPAVRFKDGKGANHTLKEFQGKYVLVNMWATWCAPCVAELPALARLKAAVPSLHVLAVDLTGKAQTPPKSLAFLKEHKAESLGAYVDTERMFMRGFLAAVMPTTVLIDPSGKIVARAEGPAEWASPAFVNYFKSLK
jgi:thiol-disulfide isomerase/thioredoxin